MRRRALAAAAAVVLTVPAPAVAGVMTRGFDLGPVVFRIQSGPGLEKVTSARLRGVLTMPPGPGRHPVVLVMHGRHDLCLEATTRRRLPEPWRCPPHEREFASYRGYGYLASALARRGFAVVAIDTNAATVVEDGPTTPLARIPADPGLRDGMRFRALLADAVLRRLAAAAAGSGAPFGQPIGGRLDLGRVGLIGHSRGGEGVVAAAKLGRAGAYRIRALFVISPVDFLRRIVPSDLPFGSIISYCDGDVSDRAGVQLFDDAYRRARTAPMFQVVALGANHDFFNSTWPDEWSRDDHTPYCGRGRGNSRRLGRPRQERLGATVATAFFARALEGDRSAASAAALGAGAYPPARIAGAAVVTSYQPPTASRLDVDGPAQPGRVPRRNWLGGRVAFRGFAAAGVCKPRVWCNPAIVQPQATTEYRLAWDAPGATLSEGLPAADRDVRRFRLLAFRTAVEFTDQRNRRLQAQSLAVVLHDAAGHRARVAVPPSAPALAFPRSVDPTRTSILGAVRLPLRAFHGVDLAHVVAIDLVFDRTPSGALLVADLSLLR